MIGRRKEIAEFQQCYDSNRSECVIVYGRRRVGKTYLVAELYSNQFAFSFVGGHHLSKKNQLKNFARALQKYTMSLYEPALNKKIKCYGFKN